MQRLTIPAEEWREFTRWLQDQCISYDLLTTRKVAGNLCNLEIEDDQECVVCLDPVNIVDRT